MTDKLIPQKRIWEIGGEQYVQEPLGLDRTAVLFSLVAETVNGLTQSGDLGAIENVDTSSTSDVMRMVATLLQKAPAILYEAIYIVLDIQGEKKHMDNVRKHCTLATVTKMAVEFVKQNDVAGIKESFLELRSELAPTSNT